MWKGIDSFGYNTEYVAIHTKLWDKEESIDRITTNLKKGGYEIILLNKDKTLSIFFNKNVDNAALEKQPKRIISMENNNDR